MNNSPPHSANNNAPVQLGHYQLRDCIGRGGMGLVYRARDTRLERDVAIKCLRTELFEAHYIERFKREALLLAKLNHPNIVQIYDFIEAPEQVALVMELVDGQNLQLYLRENLVSIKQRLQWLVQISEGLAVAHDAGIIHRDLKTENILINKRGQAKITDLGIAKSQDFNATITDHVAGSYCSMSPEQAMGETITFKSDLFSLGILAYQLLCGAHPFGDTNNKLQTMQRIISHPPTAPQKHNPDLPTEFVDLLGQLLSKDPDKRPDNTHWVSAQFTKLKELTWHDDALGDDTQALAIPLSTNTKAVRTQDHPTFDTRFVAAATAPKNSIWQKIKNYIANNKIIVSSAAASFLIIAGVVVWQLQPKPPKYVAVIPPKLTAEGMQESQQELVKGAVYDAIQQSLTQTNSYYLIPQAEIREFMGDNNSIQRATAADELVTADISCKIEFCTITLTRLIPDNEKRLRAQAVKSIDILIDNYLSLAQTVESNINGIYADSKLNIFDKIDQNEYALFLKINQDYRTKGASNDILQQLESLSISIKKLPATQTLYRDISTDLFYETKNEHYLKDLEKNLTLSNNDNEVSHLYNLYYFQITKKNFSEAEKVISKLKKITPSNSLVNELLGYSEMARNNYKAAAQYYQKSLDTRITASTLFNLANAYWYSGSTIQATEHISHALTLSPEHYKSHSLSGLIALTEGKIEKAITSFEKALQYQPADLTNLSNLGLCFLLNKEYLKAFKLFEQAHSIAPNNTTYLLNKADAINLLGDTNASQKIYLEIINSIETKKLSDHMELRNLTQAYAHIGEYSKALSILQQLERADSQNIETTYTAALVHTLANNKSAAVFNAENTIEGGLNPIWFNFFWFDSLCADNQFANLMIKHGETQRCALQ